MFRLFRLCLRLVILVMILALLWPAEAPAQATSGRAAPAGELRALATIDDARQWEGVGRLDVAGRGFCTASLIAPDIILTAAHCLFDNRSGQPVALGALEFHAGWRDGRALAHRGVRRAAAHPAYEFNGSEVAVRVSHDLALLQLDQPIRLPTLRPYEIAPQLRAGEVVGLVSYARGRADRPALQESCDVLSRRSAVVVMTCVVDAGASGAPVFTMHDGAPRIASVVSAMAEFEGAPVALGSALDDQIAMLRDWLAAGDARFQPSGHTGGALNHGGGRDGAGARFVRP